MFPRIFIILQPLPVCVNLEIVNKNTFLKIENPVALGGGPEAGAGRRVALRHPQHPAHTCTHAGEDDIYD